MRYDRQHVPPLAGTEAAAPVSQRVRVLHEARRAVLDAFPERNDRIRELTHQVKSGTYCVDGRSVAQAIARQSTGNRVA